MIRHYSVIIVSIYGKVYANQSDSIRISNFLITFLICWYSIIKQTPIIKHQLCHIILEKSMTKFTFLPLLSIQPGTSMTGGNRFMKCPITRSTWSNHQLANHLLDFSQNKLNLNIQQKLAKQKIFHKNPKCMFNNTLSYIYSSNWSHSVDKQSHIDYL